MLVYRLSDILKRDRFTKKYFGGLYNSFEFPELKEPEIIALITPPPVPGAWGHYLLLVKEFTFVEYFDSEGKPETFWDENISRHLLRVCPNYASAAGSQNLQSPANPFCGHYCIYYARERCKGKSMEEVIHSLRIIEDELERDKYAFEYVQKVEKEIMAEVLRNKDPPGYADYGMIGMLKLLDFSITF